LARVLHLFSKPYLRNFKYKVHRQRPIDQFIVDFYCPELKLVIEIDGDSHNSENAQVYDLERTQILEGYGLTVIRFTNEEVLGDFAGVCGVIGCLIPPTPRSAELTAEALKRGTCAWNVSKKTTVPKVDMVYLLVF
jgi:very-short-patch-repair endonuclease